MSLELECNELKSRHANHGYVSDEAYAEDVVKHIFCDSKYDLLLVFPPHMESLSNDYAQVFNIIGTKSLAFQILVDAGGELFDYFVSSFALHLERSVCSLPFKMVHDSVYMRLLSDYVCYMMPTGQEPPIPTRERSQIVTSPASTASPLKLIREDALRRFEVSSSTHSLRSLNSYSRSLNAQFFSFIHILVHYFTSLSSWPSDYRLGALRYVLKELHVFVLAETENAVLAQWKAQLHYNPPFADRLFSFFISLFKKWPANISFSILFDVWVAWIRPWRCFATRGPNDVQRVMQFVQANSRFYTDLSDAFWEKTFQFTTARDVQSIRNYIAVLIAPELVNVYNVLHYNVEEKLLTFANSVRLTITDLRKLIAEKEAKINKMNWVTKLFYEPDTTTEDLKSAVYELDLLVSDVQIASCGDSVQFLATEECNVSRSFVEDKIAKESSSTIPDHLVDPTTKMMYLTPLGRQQVGRGTHRFDLSDCSEAIPPLISPLKSNEIWWLSRFLYKISVYLNSTKPIQQLSDCYDQQTTLLGALARLLLDPEYPRKVVPMFATQVPFQKPCLNLRRLARYKIVVPFCILLFFQCFMSFTYNFIFSSIIFAFAYFCYA